jgi:beta-lactamase class A
MRLFVLAGLLFACVAACGGAPAATPPPTGPVAPAKPAPPAKASFPGAPVSPAGDQLAWVLDLIARRQGKVLRPELEQHFAPKFLADVPIAKAQEIFAQLGAQLTGLKIVDVQGTASALVAHVVAGELKLQISLELDATQKIAGLVVRREGDGGVALQSFGDALRAVGALAPKAQLLIAALDRGTCKPLHELGGTDQLAIGSTFKLYVLLGLVDRILAGKAAWTDELAVRDAWKSLPSGVTQNEPPGTKHPLQVYAERMISISDNTAADHLLYSLGRRTVEGAVRASGHVQPALDAPFLSTRELFVLKLGAPAELARYLKLPEARRRDYLDRTLAGKAPALDLAGAWKTARQIDKLEWFASAEDLCRLMGTLWTRAQQPKGQPLLAVLAKNPGLPIDAKMWPYIGFKGGSEPGVINMTYLLKRHDDRWFVVTLGFNAAEGAALDDEKIYGLAVAVIDLLGRTP